MILSHDWCFHPSLLSLLLSKINLKLFKDPQEEQRPRGAGPGAAVSRQQEWLVQPGGATGSPGSLGEQHGEVSWPPGAAGGVGLGHTSLVTLVCPPATCRPVPSRQGSRPAAAPGLPLGMAMATALAPGPSGNGWLAPLPLT